MLFEGDPEVIRGKGILRGSVFLHGRDESEEDQCEPEFFPIRGFGLQEKL